MSSKQQLEDTAAAVAAYVLGARARRRDAGGARVRDFDLVFPDESVEPLEITRAADPVALNTWARLENAPTAAPSLTRVWTLSVPSKVVGPAGEEPYDVARFRREVEAALAELERHGHSEFSVGLGVRDPRVETQLELLTELGVEFGVSHPLPEGEQARIHATSGVGGFVDPNSPASAIEQEANKPDNREKLREPAAARRRHLFVVVDGSTLAWAAIHNRMRGRLPDLPDPITTAWISGGHELLVCTPPAPWELHAIPQLVFEQPERWIDE